jgi:hypothetical protein
MDIGGVGAEKACLAEALYLGVLTISSYSDVSRDPGAGLPGQLPVVARHLEVGELRAGSRQSQREPLVRAGEMLGSGSDEPAGLTLFPLAPPRKSVGKNGPQA